MLKKINVKPTCRFLLSLLYVCTVKLTLTTGYLISRIHAILATENWILSDPDRN